VNGHPKQGFVVVLIFTGCLLCVPQARADPPPPRLAIKAGTVYIGDGRTIENATVLVEAGRIAAVGSDVSVPEGTPIIQVEGGTITPGLIDANARIESVNLIAPSRRQTAEHGDLRTSAAATTVSGAQWQRLRNYGQDPAGRTDTDDVTAEEEDPDSYPMFDEGPPEDLSGFAVGVLPNAVVNEQASEVVPYIRVLDAMDLRSPDWERLLRGGVTTVYASPDASAVIGARGAVLHTGGAAHERVLCPAAAVKAVIGSDPSIFGTYNRRPYGSSVDMYARRPNSRMGVTWVFRKAFYDADRRGRGVEAYGADTASPEASAVLREVRAGKIPLRIQARIQQDILTALRLAKEFDLRFTLEEATEAYRCLDELQQASVPVVFGPIYERPDGIRLRSGEGQRSRYYTFRALLERGIKTALSAQEFREEDGLARQAMYAVRFGVGFDDALRAVTQTPARFLGLDDQLGTVEVGKRADLVLWSGRPFAATSAAVVVLIDGRVVVDRRGGQLSVVSCQYSGGPS
jgi:imidazolonepropionase-like amidohydrolase